MSARTKDDLLTELDNQANQMITDRTLQDAKDLLAILAKAYDDMTPEEQYIVTHPHKGAYNYTDLNRVSIYCNALVEVMSRFYGTTTDEYVALPENWLNIIDPTMAQLVQYIASIMAVREKWELLLHIENPLTIEEIYAGISFDTANNIEKSLLLIHEAVNTYIFAYDDRYCGQLYGADASYTIPCGYSLQNDIDSNGLWMGLD